MSQGRYLFVSLSLTPSYVTLSLQAVALLPATVRQPGLRRSLSATPAAAPPPSASTKFVDLLGWAHQTLANHTDPPDGL